MATQHSSEVGGLGCTFVHGRSCWFDLRFVCQKVGLEMVTVMVSIMGFRSVVVVVDGDTINHVGRYAAGWIAKEV